MVQLASHACFWERSHADSQKGPGSRTRTCNLLAARRKRQPLHHRVAPILMKYSLDIYNHAKKNPFHHIVLFYICKMFNLRGKKKEYTVYVMMMKVCLESCTYSVNYRHSSFKIAPPSSPLIIFKEKALDGFMGRSCSVQGG